MRQANIFILNILSLDLHIFACCMLSDEAAQNINKPERIKSI